MLECSFASQLAESATCFGRSRLLKYFASALYPHWANLLAAEKIAERQPCESVDARALSIWEASTTTAKVHAWTNTARVARSRRDIRRADDRFMTTPRTDRCDRCHSARVLFVPGQHQPG